MVSAALHAMYQLMPLMVGLLLCWVAREGASEEQSSKSSEDVS